MDPQGISPTSRGPWWRPCYLKLDVENLVEIKRKDKSLPEDPTTPIPGSCPSKTRQSSYCGRVASPGTARCLSCPPSPVNTKWLGKASLNASRPVRAMVNIMLEGAERKARNKLLSDAVHNEDLENYNDAKAEKDIH